MAIDKVKSISM